jgi:MFS family permease
MGVNVAPSIGYVYTVYAIGFMIASLGVSRRVALTSLIVAALCGSIASIGFGALSDHIGRRKIMLAGAIFSALYAFPFFWLLETRDPILITLAMTIGFAIGLRSIFGVQPAFYTELFETRLRYSGIALAREVTGALVGGPLPLVATAFVAGVGGAWWPVAAIMVVLALVTVVAVLAAPPPVSPDSPDA